MTRADELRLFVVTDVYHVKGRGKVYCGPCPFTWNKEDGLGAWAGRWLISSPEAEHDRTYTVKGVESFCLQVIREGSPVGIVVESNEDQEVAGPPGDEYGIGVVWRVISTRGY